MPCNDTTPCNEVNPCDPCNEHDNCGCLHPTTFGCTVHTGSALPCLGVVNGEDGNSILTKLESKICNIGKVLIDGTDICPEPLIDKLAAGLNISLTQIGTGCSRQIRIDSSVGGVAVDVNVKVSVNDTTSGYLATKIDTGVYMTETIVNPGGNEILRLDILPATLVSTDGGNQLGIGTDGGLITLYTFPDGTETKVIAGVGVIVTGTGSIVDPYIISTNPTIQVARPCFDGVWRNITLVVSGNPFVTNTSGAPQYRYRFDGTIEFRRSITYLVNFGTYLIGPRKFTIPMGSIPISCVTAVELAGTADLKGINYIDTFQASPDQIVQQYGYIIRKNGQNLILEFQSSFTLPTNKSIVINFEGVVIHPNL